MAGEVTCPCDSPQATLTALDGQHGHREAEVCVSDPLLFANQLHASKYSLCVPS